MAQMPADVVAALVAVFADASGLPTAIVHGDPGPSNLRITVGGRVGLLDWDESRIDVTLLDLADLGVQTLDDAHARRATLLAHAWEVANAWVAEPGYARRRLAALRGMDV
jgi:Ser/Thr protein kinase RdoA (MazF antagonist)